MVAAPGRERLLTRLRFREAFPDDEALFSNRFTSGFEKSHWLETDLRDDSSPRVLG
jgi:hypothetical protein